MERRRAVLDLRARDPPTIGLKYIRLDVYLSLTGVLYDGGGVGGCPPNFYVLKENLMYLSGRIFFIALCT